MLVTRPSELVKHLMSKFQLRVVVTDGRGRSRPARGLVKWLSTVAPKRFYGEVVVALVCDAKMRALNKRYRNLDRVTDVLSFPAEVYPHQDQSSSRVLGDIVIATGVAKRQARDEGVSVDMEIRRLALHGLLHVMGYDHEKDTGQMNRLERRLLRRGGMAELTV